MGRNKLPTSERKQRLVIYVSGEAIAYHGGRKQAQRLAANHLEQAKHKRKK